MVKLATRLSGVSMVHIEIRGSSLQNFTRLFFSVHYKAAPTPWQKLFEIKSDIYWWDTELRFKVDCSFTNVFSERQAKPPNNLLSPKKLQ